MAKEDSQQVKSKRDAMSERLSSKYPDMDFSDEEVMFGRISDDYDDYDGQIANYKKNEEDLVNMMNIDPRSAYFLDNMKKGNDPVVEFVRMFGTDIKDRLEDPEWQEKLAEANKDFVERVAKEKELEEQYNANLESTKENLRQFQEAHGLSDDELDEVFGILAGIVGDGIVGKFSTESMELAMKAINHDVDVEEAAAEAEVKGRNAKIDEKLRTRQAGDGTAALNGKNGSAGVPNNRPQLGALDNYGEGLQNIWERGGEKRTRYNG